MAALIIEIRGRHTSQYYKVDKPTTRVGRALDNDIILSDPTVSPYHFIIRKDGKGAYELHSLADANGIRIGRRQVRGPVPLNRLPVAVEAGRTHVRILDPRQPVAPTRLVSCRNGGVCVFGHWTWATLLFAAFIVLSGIDNYLSTPSVLSWDSFWRDQVVIVSVALGLSFGLLAVNRITSHRWDYPSALSFVSIILGLALLIDQVTPFFNYFFTSPAPSHLMSVTWTLLILPATLGWFLISLNHGNRMASILFIVFLVSPAAYMQLKDVFDYYNVFGDFSKTANYSSSLYPGDYRLKQTVTVEKFLTESTARISPEADENL